jgi:hypothetical protein
VSVTIDDGVRRAAALTLALFFPFVTDPIAQNATQDDGKREVVVSGCLLRSGYAGYQVDDARVDAIDGKTIEPPQAAAMKMPGKWILDGGGNLGPRAGEKVQVVGRSDWMPGDAGAENEPARTPHLDVKSVKTLAPMCQ